MRVAHSHIRAEAINAIGVLDVARVANAAGTHLAALREERRPKDWLPSFKELPSS
jgi:hypothetical protein